MRAMEWAADAACRHVNVSGEDDPFHPDRDAIYDRLEGAVLRPDLDWEAIADFAYLEQVADAKELCAGCPVAADCLLYALAEGGTEKDGRWQSTWAGIWGGYTAEEREALLNSIHEEEPPCETTTETQTSEPEPREASPFLTSLSSPYNSKTSSAESIARSGASSPGALLVRDIGDTPSNGRTVLLSVASKRGKHGRRRSRKRR